MRYRWASASGRIGSDLANTLAAADRLVRLPMWLGLEEHQDQVIDSIIRAAQ